MNKIEVKICMGTTCFIMCNADLEDLEQEIAPAILPYIQLSGSPCLGLCKDAQFHRIPCALIDGKPIENIDKKKLLEAIEQTVTERFLVKNNYGK